MYRQNPMAKTTIKRNESYQGETIEQKINRIVNNKEPIKDGAPLIYTERKDGIQPEHDIRTDRWEIAVDAMDAVTKAELAKRQARIDAQLKKDQPNDKDQKSNTDKNQPNKDSKQNPGEGTSVNTRD